MCRRVECGECGKPSFKGCGLHVEQVLGDVPHAERCRCHEDAEDRDSGNAGRSISWLGALRKSMGE